MTHLAFPSVKKRAAELPSALVTEELMQRTAASAQWPTHVRRAIRRGLCRSEEVQKALNAEIPARALRTLGWTIHSRVLQRLVDEAPSLDAELLPNGESLQSPGRRQSVAEWLTHAAQAGLIGEQDIQKALDSPHRDMALMQCALRAWHALAEDVVKEARRRRLCPSNTATEKLFVGAGWALDFGNSSTDDIYIEHANTAAVTWMPSESPTPSNRALLFGLGLIQRHFCTVFVLGPSDLYSEGSPLSSYRDEIVAQFLDAEKLPDDAPPPADLVATYEAEFGVNLLNEPEEWESIKQMAKVHRHASKWSAPRVAKSTAAQRRQVARMKAGANRPAQRWVDDCLAAASWLQESAERLGELLPAGEDEMTGVMWIFPARLVGDEDVRINDYFNNLSADSGYLGYAFNASNRVEAARRAMMEALLFATLKERFPRRHA